MDDKSINHAAALLFWTFTDKVQYADAIDQFTEDGVEIFIKVPYFHEVLNICGIEVPSSKSFFGEIYSQNFLNEIKRKISSEIDLHLTKDLQLMGPLYLDEIQTGRSLEAKEVDVSSAVSSVFDLRVRVDGCKESVGSLCLRHPLPAVIVSTRPVKLNEYYRVESTFDALGCEYPLYFRNIGCIEVSSDLYILSGIFKIPVIDTNHYKCWSHIIQNSSSFSEYLEIVR
jgi:hypothetical protein